MRLGLFLAVLCCALPVRARAQSDVVAQSLSWFGYLATVETPGPWSALLEAHERRWFEPFRVQQRALRVHAIRQLNRRWSLSLGAATFWQGAQFPEQPAIAMPLEIRPHVQLEARVPGASQVTFGSRTRLEYRAFSRTAEGLAVDRFDHAGRLRQMLSAERVVARMDGQPVVARVSDELMLMFGDRDFERSFDQNRLQGTVVLPLGRRGTRLEVAYMWLWQGRRAGGVFDRDVLRLNLLQRFGRD